MKNYNGHLCVLLLLCLIFNSSKAIAYDSFSTPFTPNTLLSPQQVLSGTVTDSRGIPLAGVSISLQNSTRGTTTDTKGYYTLQVPDNAVLSFQSLGFERQEIKVGNQTSLDVVLQDDITALNVVEINAGYYSTTEKERTGNIAKVSGEDLELQPVVSPLQALQGRMAGVSVIEKNGVPGNAPSIMIRGQNSLRTAYNDNGNLPLYIIDGVPIDASPLNSFTVLLSPNVSGIDPLNTLNLTNIKSIEVLKDADATAIYGSRGANGVVLITTKNGAEGTARQGLSARVYTGVSTVPTRLDLLKTEDYLSLRREAFENDGRNPTNGNARDLLLWEDDRYTDWQDVLFGGTAHTTDINLSTTGGNAQTRYRLGGGYHRQTTVFPGDFSYRKVTVGIGLHHQSKDNRFKLALSANYGSDVNNLFDESSMVSKAITLAPNAPALYTEDGMLNWEDSTWDNPLAVLYKESDGRVHQLKSSLGLSYALGWGVTAKVNTGYTRLSSNEVIKQPIRATDPADWATAEHRSSHQQSTRGSWIVEPQLQYDKQIGDLEINALAGATFQQRMATSLSAIGTGYASEQLIGNLAAADMVNVTSGTEVLYNYEAVFARLGLHYKNRYLLNLTGRRDGSSRFGAARRFANFGAVGAGWIFSEEEAFQTALPWLSFGKLRGSYGTTGSDQIGDYGYLDTYSATPGPGGLYPTQLTNPNYSWESNRKLELGIDLAFIKDRLRLNTSWYRNRSSNQLVGYPLPAITGFNTVQANLDATVENKGWEIVASSSNIQTANWRWKTDLNISLPRNTLISFPDIEQTSYATIYTVGESLSAQRFYNYTGVDSETGYYTVEDVNDDGALDFEDQTIIKDLGRTLFGGFRNTITYKKLSLDFLIEFVQQDGQQYYPNTPPGRFGNILREDYVNRWQDEGDNRGVQRASSSISALLGYSRGLQSSLVVSDNSFIRLKTVGLSYQFNWKALHVQQSRVFLQGQNLLTLTNYRGLDPQFTGNTLPALRTITGGLELKF